MTTSYNSICIKYIETTITYAKYTTIYTYPIQNGRRLFGVWSLGDSTIGAGNNMSLWAVHSLANIRKFNWIERHSRDIRRENTNRTFRNSQ